MSTEKQIAANRLNSQKSTGPKTEEGKAISSRNHTIHGLFAKELTIPGEDQQAYEAFAAAVYEEFNPITHSEIGSVQRMVLARWRQMRLWSMEAGVLTKQITSHAEDAESIAETPAIRAASAWTAIAGADGGFRHINRVEVSLDRMYARALKELQTSRQNNGISVRSHLG